MELSLRIISPQEGSNCWSNPCDVCVMIGMTCTIVVPQYAVRVCVEIEEAQGRIQDLAMGGPRF